MANLETFSSGVEQKERPAVLYHASHNPDIEEFVPRNDRIRDPKEGPVVFATPDKGLASTFLVEGHNDDWMQIGFYSGIPVVVVLMDRDSFIARDHGGTLYLLPSDSFGFDERRGMGEKEWTSHQPVKPLAKIEHPSALDAMIENGVQVYFVDKDMFTAIRDAISSADDLGMSILESITSENQLRGEHVVSFSKILKDAHNFKR